MTRTLLSALLCLAPLPALAQDVLAQAAQTYRGLTGEWAEPSKSCADPIDTWVFGMETVTAGTLPLRILGIGAGGQGITVDLASEVTGERVPLALIPTGSGVSVRGSGISADLQRCTGVAQVEPLVEPQDDLASLSQDQITSEPLDSDIPSSQELQDALAAAGSGAGTTVEPATDTGTDTATADSTDPEVDADEAYRTAYAGSYSSGGACDWRIDGDRITADGTGFGVVNVTGDTGKLGVQALRDDGTPATFTLTQASGGTQVSGSVGEDETLNATLSRC